MNRCSPGWMNLGLVPLQINPTRWGSAILFRRDALHVVAALAPLADKSSSRPMALKSDSRAPQGRVVRIEREREEHRRRCGNVEIALLAISKGGGRRWETRGRAAIPVTARRDFSTGVHRPAFPQRSSGHAMGPRSPAVSLTHRFCYRARHR